MLPVDRQSKVTKTKQIKILNAGRIMSFWLLIQFSVSFHPCLCFCVHLSSVFCSFQTSMAASGPEEEAVATVTTPTPTTCPRLPRFTSQVSQTCSKVLFCQCFLYSNYVSLSVIMLVKSVWHWQKHCFDKTITKSEAVYFDFDPALSVEPMVRIKRMIVSTYSHLIW